MAPESPKVLLVDDHEGQRLLLREMLEALGVEYITEAESGHSAVALLHRPDYQPDLVITDLNMRDGDGFDVLRAVARLPRPPQLAMISAVDEDVLAAVARIQAPDSTLRISAIAKPVTLDRLRELIADLGPSRRRGLPAAPPPPDSDIARGIKACEFVAFLEPQVDLRSGEVVGFEALARWRHPQRGLVAPYAFIPTIERSALMPDFTVALFDNLLSTRTRLLAAGFTGKLSVNIGAECLAIPDFPARMQECLRRHQLDNGEGITLELTESSGIGDPVDAVSGLARLRLLGFELAIDDFGVGHSSLANMQNAAFSEIKIDHQFTSRVLTDRLSRAAIESIVHIAMSLGWLCVAEGIETEDIRLALVSMGCTTGQGYLFSKPVDPDDVVDWLQHWQQRPAIARQLPPAHRLLNVAAAARRDGYLLIDTAQLAQLEKRDIPSWLFDLDSYRMRWANSAALRFWKASSLEALIERDFKSDISAAARTRLRSYLDLLAGGSVRTERWTLYPLGEPISSDCMLTGVMTPDGSRAMLVEAFRSGSLVASTVFEVETAVAAPVPILVLGWDGRLLWRNPAATLAFGDAPEQFAALFADPLLGESLIGATQKAGERQLDAALHSLAGPCWQRVQLRTTRDPTNGEPLMVASLTSIDDLVPGGSRRSAAEPIELLPAGLSLPG